MKVLALVFFPDDTIHNHDTILEMETERNFLAASSLSLSHILPFSLGQKKAEESKNSERERERKKVWNKYEM